MWYFRIPIKTSLSSALAEFVEIITAGDFASVIPAYVSCFAARSSARFSWSQKGSCVGNDTSIIARERCGLEILLNIYVFSCAYFDSLRLLPCSYAPSMGNAGPGGLLLVAQ